MFAGTAFGQALATIPSIPFFSSLPPVLLAMTAAAGMLAHHTRPYWHPSPRLQVMISQLTALTQEPAGAGMMRAHTPACITFHAVRVRQAAAFCLATATRIACLLQDWMW